MNRPRRPLPVIGSQQDKNMDSFVLYLLMLIIFGKMIIMGRLFAY